MGKDRHHACVRDLSKDVYCKAFSITNDRNGFLELIAALEKLSSEKSDILIGVEACSYALNLSCFLMGMGYNLVEVNPFRVGQFRKAQGKKAKTDKIDARTIAAILSLGDHKTLSVPDPILDNLKELTRFRAGLVDERATMIIHLREALSVLFPEFEKVFRQLDSAGSLALLAAFPGPELIIAAGEETVGKTLSLASPRRMSRGMARRIIEAAKGTVGVLQKQPAWGSRSPFWQRGSRAYNRPSASSKGRSPLSSTAYRVSHRVFLWGARHTLAAIVAEIGDIHRFATLKEIPVSSRLVPSEFSDWELPVGAPKDESRRK